MTNRVIYEVYYLLFEEFHSDPRIRRYVNTLTENGIVIPPNDTESLVNAFNRYYHEKKLINDHGNKNIAIAKERADWDKNYLKLKNIYNKLTGS